MSEPVMRFGGVYLSHNPAELKVVRRKTVSSGRNLSGGRYTENILGEPETVSGKGALFGDRCFDELSQLTEMCSRNEPAVLALPELGAFYAVLTRLSLAAEPRENYIAVSFEFSGADGKQRPKISRQPVYIAEDSESLWDISYRFGVDIDSLIRLNPHIRRIENLNEGERVILC